MTDWTKNPGSPEAVAAGCTCPVIDNHHGEGRGLDGVFIISLNCQLHAPPERVRPDLGTVVCQGCGESVIHAPGELPGRCPNCFDQIGGEAG